MFTCVSVTIVFYHLAYEKRLLFLQWKNCSSLQCVASRLINSVAQWVGDRKVIQLTNCPVYLYRYVTHWLTAKIHISCDINHMSSYFRLWICQVQVTYIVICGVASPEMKWLKEERLPLKSWGHTKSFSNSFSFTHNCKLAQIRYIAEIGLSYWKMSVFKISGTLTSDQASTQKKKVPLEDLGIVVCNSCPNWVVGWLFPLSSY